MRFSNYLITTLLVAAPVFAQANTQALSPTGRNPQFLWTPARQAIWDRMRADYLDNPISPDTSGGRWFKYIKTTADCACAYSDFGNWPTLMYQMTGDKRYVELAWNRLQTTFFAKPFDS